ncbi:hypothetical protein BDW22DRAFT_1425131 [Trametopsis cervina]|nr:hypothetical protein BDW22DRAFT_1425131 [Trametopsis cervina]
MFSDTDPSSDATSQSLENTQPSDFTSIATHIIPNSEISAPLRSPKKRRSKSPDDSGEEALEWHEVIELQAFSERKLLEKMPPIQVFVGLDAVRASAEEVPGLPTRAELKQWVVEHDKIEKETEIFDSGELKKLKKFTKAAAQRNLSPEDTDLIELTLTTIYALDRLLHLLRDRSDSLDLLGDRLAWEEKRITAWGELRNIVEDLQNFLDTRARWSPSVYERGSDEEENALATAAPPSTVPTLRRKGSMSSLMSTASDSTISSLAISRGERFKLAEILSRDAAQFASRVSSLRHSKITSAGKALDKLIDNSRRPVPDELLDEQDRLEERGISNMEDVGKFVMSVVMQWKKADEIYVETVKDKSAAQTLLEEIEIARFNHPTSRQDTAFLSRSTALSKRLRMRENPASPMSFFPRPSHRLFPNQDQTNTDIVYTLTNELTAAQEQVQDAERAAREYHGVYEKVKKVESASKTASDLTDQLESLSHRLETGIESSAGDGSPPTLSSEACLQDQSHSVFLAHASTLLDETTRAEQAATLAISAGRAALADLPRTGIDSQFVQDSIAVFDRLASYRISAVNIRDTVSRRIDTLRKCRTIWSAMAEAFEKIDELRCSMVDAIPKQLYKPNASPDAALLTPESPVSPLSPSEITLQEAQERILEIVWVLEGQVVVSLSSVSSSLGPTLRAYLSDCTSGLKQSLEKLRSTTRFWHLAQQQTSEMALVCDDTHTLQMRSEHLKLRFENGMQDILLGQLSGDDLQRTEGELEVEVKELQADIQTFQEKLSSRTPFIGSEDSAPQSTSTPALAGRRFSISGFSLDVVRQAAQVGLPFDTSALDRYVRADANSYSMMLAGEAEILSQRANYFRWARHVRDIDVAVTHVADGLLDAASTMNSLQSTLDDEGDSPSLPVLSNITAKVDTLYREMGQSLASSCLEARDLLDRLEAAVGHRDSYYESSTLLPRKSAVQEAEENFNSWRESVEVLSERLSDMQHSERMRLEAEARAKAEADRLETERKLEQDRLQQERLEQERLEQERREQERREQERREQERREQERREQERLEQERLEKERFVQERLEQELLEKERLEQDRLEQDRLEQDRLEQERLEQERLAQERLQAERSKKEAQESTEREQLQAESKAQAEEDIRLDEAPERTVQGIASTSNHTTQLQETVLDSAEPVPSGSVTQADNRKRRVGPVHAADIFGIVKSDSMGSEKSEEDTNIQATIVSLRKRLRVLNINEIARPPRGASANLPSQELITGLEKQFTEIEDETRALPSDIPTAPYVDAELRSLRSELVASSSLIIKIRALADISHAVQQCDDALSDLLEHIDSYPAPPTATLSLLHATDTSCPPEEQMSNRLSHTETLVHEVVSRTTAVADDSRATSERDRITQTWEELQAMGNDRIIGQKSRPASAMSSGRQSSMSVAPSSRESAPYSKLSAAPSGSKYLAPPPQTRRSASGSSAPRHSRPSSRASVASTNRSVSGPPRAPSSRPIPGSSKAPKNASVSSIVNAPPTNSRLYTSTFASRQRSSSISSTIASVIGSPKPGTPTLPSIPRAPVSRPRARTGQSTHERVGSPLAPEMLRSQSRSSLNLSRSSVSANRSTWSRAPRQSFPHIPKSPPPRKPVSTEKKPYVPNPKNKLDMAVGDVVNNLPVNINIEVVAETWKDQSGKYWIGDDDPKLCFCRILRSQTVMVRVGGGWTELSKFIKEHFADAFRVLPLPESPPPRVGSGEEKWISSATLSKAMSDKAQSPPLPPSTPEPSMPFIPSFALSTPSGTSPRSIKTSSPGSPLHPIQFIRRAERELLASRPETPTKAPRSSSALSHTPRQPAWRP